MEFSVAELIKRADKTRQPELVLPAIIPPQGLELDLRAVYRRVVAAWNTAARKGILPAYSVTLAEGVRDAPADVKDEVEDSAAAITRLVLTLTPVIEDWVVRVEQWHRQRFVQSFVPTGVKLDTLLGPANVKSTLESVLAENVALIRSLNEQMRNDISGAVFRGLTNRSPAREVSKEITRLTGIARRRADLIAADQLQKLTGRLDQERQQQLGLDTFQWAHSHKLHPRPHHVARDGMKFKWDSVVGRTDPPGRAIRCGCRARAVVKL